MKYFINLIRILTGLLFIFSGFIKSNDPHGFEYKLEEYFSVFAADLEAKQDTIFIFISTGNDEATYKKVLAENSSQLNVELFSSPWQAELIGEDTISKSVLYVKIDGQNYDELPLYAMAEGKVFVKANIDDNVLTDQSGAITSSQEFKLSSSASVQEFAKSNSVFVSLLEGLKPFALFLAIFICIFEIVLGIALIIGWKPKLVLWLLLIMLIFFTFLTWYSATYNKVTDCGCFGNAIPLNPWQSFYKDLILLFAVLILFAGLRFIKPLFRTPSNIKILTVGTILSLGFSLYCWYYLPVFNFLQFKKGVNIIEKENDGQAPHIQKIYSGTLNGEEIKIAYDSKTEEFNPKWQKGMKIGKQIEEKTISEGKQASIHDFVFNDADGNDQKEEFYKEGYKLLVVMYDLNKTRIKSLKKLLALTQSLEEEPVKIWFLSSGAAQDIEEFKHQHQIPHPIYLGDNTNQKGIVRSNPGLLLIKDATIIDIWPGTKLPSKEKVIELMSQ